MYKVHPADADPPTRALAVRRDGSGSVEIVINGARFTEADAEAHVHGICFKTGPPERVGVELEWLVRDRRDPALPVQAEQVAATLAGFDGHSDEEGYSGQAPQPVRYQFPSLPSGASLTVEPGGQLELSSAPAATLGELLEVTGRDLAALRDAASAVGLELCGYGLDPLRPPRRVLDLPRYAAMEKFFDREGPWGRRMMCGTASVQVCVDAGDDSQASPDTVRAGGCCTRSGRCWWRRSPTPRCASGGRPAGVRAGSRCGPTWTRAGPGPRPFGAADGDPRDAWAAYALDAELMCVREPGSQDWTAPPGLTFRDWLRDGGSGPAAGAHRLRTWTIICPRCSRRSARMGTWSCG